MMGYLPKWLADNANLANSAKVYQLVPGANFPTWSRQLLAQSSFSLFCSPQMLISGPHTLPACLSLSGQAQRLFYQVSDKTSEKPDTNNPIIFLLSCLLYLSFSQALCVSSVTPSVSLLVGAALCGLLGLDWPTHRLYLDDWSRKTSHPLIYFKMLFNCNLGFV